MTLMQRVCWLVPAACMVALPSLVSAQGSNPDGWSRYVTFDETKCEVDEKDGSKQVIHLKFDVVDDVPRGTKINFELEYLGSEVERKEYEVKGAPRKDLIMKWTPKKLLAPGDYILRTRIILDDQTPAIQKTFKRLSKRFPPKNAPWPYYYMNDKDTIRVADTMDPEMVQKALEEVYGGFMDGLVDSMIEFVDEMKEVKDGKKHVNGARLDVKKFTEYVVAWRKKHGAVQKKIRSFPMDEPALFQKSQAAWFLVSDLGRMVAKRSIVIQDALTKKYGIQDPIKLASSREFDSNYRLKDVSVKALQAKLAQIEAIVFPPEEEPPPAEAGEGEQPADGEEAPKKAPAKKAPGKKTTPKK